MTTDTILNPTADNRVVALRKIKDAHFALATIAGGLKEGETLDAELATSCLRVAEFNLSDLGKALGIQTDSAKDREQRFADLRAANTRIRELETQLGNVQPPELTQMSLKNLSAQINGWWDLEGFGHISDISFGQYCCKVNFSCNLFGDFFLVDSATPVSDKERKAAWHESLRQRGFLLTEEDRDVSIVDCDASRKALCDLIQTRLPSARIFKIENVHKHKGSGFVLRGVEVTIHKIADILDLPIPVKKAS